METNRTTAPAAGPLMLALMAHREGLAAYIDRHMPAALRSSVDAGDVLQDVCCEAIRYESTFVALDGSAGRRWLYTVARHQITRLLERRMRWGLVTPDDPLLSMLEELARYERTPSQSAVSHETWLAVQQSLDRLPPQYAGVIRSRYLERLPAAEVASRTGRTPAAVDQLCYRAMAALRVELRSLIVAHH